MGPAKSILAKSAAALAMLLAIGSASAVAHTNSSPTHDWEAVSYHNSSANIECIGGDKVNAKGYAKDFDNKSHIMTREVQDHVTGQWDTRTDSFIGSASYNNWDTPYDKNDFAKLSTNWHTWFDSFGADTKLVVMCD